MVDTMETCEAPRLAQRALHDSRIGALQDLTIEQHGENLIISGQVDTFYLKQLAQELIRAAVDECQLINNVDVNYRLEL